MKQTKRSKIMNKPIEMTKKEWSQTHKDSKSVIDGIHYVMKLIEGPFGLKDMTALIPVLIVIKKKGAK